MTRAQIDMVPIVADLKADFAALREATTQGYTVPITEAAEHAIARLETFCAIATRIMRDTNPSRVREAARTEEIRARIHGRDVLEDDHG